MAYAKAITHTHPGYAADSAWASGQVWTMCGFADRAAGAEGVYRRQEQRVPPSLIDRCRPDGGALRHEGQLVLWRWWHAQNTHEAHSIYA